MLKNILSRTKPRTSPANQVLADLRRVLKTGRRVEFRHQNQVLGMAIVAGIEDDRLLFEPLEPLQNLLESSVVGSIERGVPWSFPVTGLKQISEGSDIYLQSEIPVKIDINSRRGDFRVITPASSVFELHFEIEAKSFSATILDLSRSGTRVKIADGESIPLEIDQRVDNATLFLNDYGSKTISFQVHRISSSDRTTSLGLCFCDMSSADSDELYRIVCEIERENIRRIKRLDS